MLHCLFLLFSTMIGDSFQNGITSVTNAVQALESNSVTLSCNYTSSRTGDSLHWYRQYPRSKPEFLILISRIKDREDKAGFTWYHQHPGSKPEFLILIYAEEKTDKRFTVKHDKTNRHVQLEISSAEVSDSALYYCAVKIPVGNIGWILQLGHDIGQLL
ncbi:T cell receptor alpha variable 20 [Conger conger]|uniref:T cell receptor alpha variable 20 n=1 Tax=Conger conger TaxID=82655 RepID=UPI002A5AF5DB|nr:T cell receptor alpha variable 20 [Conger conger]